MVQHYWSGKYRIVLRTWTYDCTVFEDGDTDEHRQQIKCTVNTKDGLQRLLRIG